MNTLNFSDNLVRLRRKKQITQEELADFIGITKASVSKWETKQSMPDILLLPELAAFFDVSIDDLLGYDPQMSREQIQRIYQELAGAFAHCPFEETMAKSQELSKQYYSCYPLLLQICGLWLNHFMLAESRGRQEEILADLCNLCSHIISDCRDIGLCNDAVFLRASAELILGHSGEVIEDLESLLDPYRLSSQSDTLLIQAYQLAGQSRDAERFTQISMFVHLLSLVADATCYLQLHKEDVSVFEETFVRIRSLLEAFHLDRLHPHTAALFWYQSAITCCFHGRNQQALEFLNQYASCISFLLQAENPVFSGDSYFDSVESWYEGSPLGNHAPRDKKIIYASALQALDNPEFEAIREEPAFQSIQTILTEKGGLL